VRIVAIRGCNLASLAGEFEVVLDQGPLGQVGLFAITGPTGSGKSTLLDAACLALFDAIPRLRTAKSSSRVRASLDEDAESLTATDPRLCLRRGAGEGWAEVEFLDAHGSRFRARWSVHRARRKPDGRVQTSELGLWDAEGATVAGGRKTDVLAAIEERLGLGFEQFRRAALLAQGEFAAFLHAEPTLRADVLERVTGTELYKQIGEAVFERFRREESALADLERRLAEVGVLPEQERQDLEARQEQLAAEAEARDAAVLQANQALGWHASHQDLQERVQSARHGVASAQQAWEAAAPERERLRALAELEPLRTVFEQAREREQARTEAAEQVQQLERARQHRVEQAQQASQAEASASTVLSRAQQAWEAVQPELEQARAHDARIQELRTARDREAQARRQAQEQVAPLVEQVKELDAALERAVEQARAAEAWFEDHPVAAERLRRAEELDRGLQRLHEARRRHHQARDEAQALDERLGRARKDADAAAEAHRKAELEQNQARKQLQAQQSALDDLDAQALEERAQAVSTERAWLEGLREPAQRAADATERESTARQAVEQASERLQAITAEREPLEARHEREASRLEEAQDTLDRLRRAVGLEDRRGELVQGEPCPLCGSTEHPWRQDGAPTPAVVREQEQRVHDLDQQRIGRERQRAALEQEQRQLQAQRERDGQALEQAQARRAAAEQAWSAVQAPEGRAPLPSSPDLHALHDRLDACAAAEREISSARQQLAQAQRRVQQARQALDQADRTEADRDQAFRAARELSFKLDTQARSAHERLDQAQATVTESVEALDVLTDLAGEAPADAAADAVDALAHASVQALRQALHAEREQARAHQQALEAHARASQHEAPQRETLRARLHAAEEQARVATQRHEQAQSDLLDAEQARAALLDGRPVQAVTTHHKQVLDARRAELDRAVDQSRQAESQAAAAQARAQEARQDLARATTNHERSQAELAQAASQAGVTLDDLRERLAVPREQIDALRTRLTDLDAALERARTVAQERSQALARHQQSEDNPHIPKDFIETRLGELEAAKRASQIERGKVQSALDRDAEAQERARTLTAERDAQASRLHTWARLSKLIGSRDGRSFKRFAQSLTLDALLEHANHHLDDLAPRYRLVRVPGSELDLQVIDRHMGDEVRGVHTLSGGESFLASLALAQGLASLSSADTPVDTLFIDEGFGTLDRETLDVALAALDALQATGRQVGIISHVSGLAERIGTQVRVVPTGAGSSRVEVQRA